ncbi:TfoX/Sxy family transcriptional regulator of competence genes [Saonia flava]|uniref:TfoX/Sxy family transcriptional regulator of competence genes n=1 Tax=Saonia flava TaxID=523696 RepID=A0A846QMS8_9FLAO|nr:TfoX/Sxy family protein [Saonia flava]NJB70316.1 TfoX/Sxy family transcriptional regulator of competence genes [Saonia flava]
MTCNQEIAKRIRESLRVFPRDFTEKKMFGGISFLHHRKMTVGVIKEDLAVRVISNKMEGLMQLDAVRPMDFTKTALKEFIYVSLEGFKTDEQVQNWIELGLEHAKNKL